MSNLQGLRNLIEIIARYHRVPKLDWLLLCMAAVDPDHAIWQRGYRPPVIKPDRAKQQVLYDNSDNFWDAATEVSATDPGPTIQYKW